MRKIGLFAFAAFLAASAPFYMSASAQADEDHACNASSSLNGCDVKDAAIVAAGAAFILGLIVLLSDKHGNDQHQNTVSP